MSQLLVSAVAGLSTNSVAFDLLVMAWLLAILLLVTLDSLAWVARSSSSFSSPLSSYGVTGMLVERVVGGTVVCKEIVLVVTLVVGQHGRWWEDLPSAEGEVCQGCEESEFPLGRYVSIGGRR